MSIDSEILRVLRASPEGLSSIELASRLGIQRGAVAPRIDALRSLGYDIAASPHAGYRLLGSPDLLHADDLLSRLGRTRVVGRTIEVFEETSSTNDIVERLARDGVREGVVVFAETQTKGRGRLGRKWLSPVRQGLWMSVLLRPKLPARAVTQLTIASATALARAIQAQTGLLPTIKWPNDILLKGRKVAGILTEMSGELDAVRHVIVGIGVDVNVAEFPAELRRQATSLMIETGERQDRAQLAAGILRELDRDYGRISAGRFEEIADDWERRCDTIGQDVAIVVGSQRIQGRAEALDGDGALLVRTQHGRLERVVGGDVAMLK